MKKRTLISLAIVSFIMNGCVNSLSNMDVQNKDLNKQYMPTRFYKTSTKGADFYKSDWAGERGNSIALNSEIIYSDILKSFKQNCGFSKDDLLETRIVSHLHPKYYEVWVFKDKLSKRDDKTSALSVVLTQVPNGGGVDMNFYGKCHSDEPLQFIFTN